MDIGSLVVWLIIVAVLAVAAWWFCDQLPAPLQTVGRIIVAGLVLLALIYLLMPMLGRSPVIRLR